MALNPLLEWNCRGIIWSFQHEPPRLNLSMTHVSLFCCFLGLRPAQFPNEKCSPSTEIVKNPGKILLEFTFQDVYKATLKSQILSCHATVLSETDLGHMQAGWSNPSYPACIWAWHSVSPTICDKFSPWNTLYKNCKYCGIEIWKIGWISYCWAPKQCVSCCENYISWKYSI